MAEKKTKKDIYTIILPQIEFLYKEETDQTANLANAVALLKSTTLPFFWIGFYIVRGEELILGPFQGLPATTRIGYGLGVCGTSWKDEKSILVPNVHLFPGHIACNCYSQSEVVIPVFSNGKVVAVLDIDSDQKDDFDEVDVLYLEQIAEVIGQNWKE